MTSKVATRSASAVSSDASGGTSPGTNPFSRFRAANGAPHFNVKQDRTADSSSSSSSSSSSRVRRADSDGSASMGGGGEHGFTRDVDAANGLKLTFNTRLLPESKQIGELNRLAERMGDQDSVVSKTACQTLGTYAAQGGPLGDAAAALLEQAFEQAHDDEDDDGAIQDRDRANLKTNLDFALNAADLAVARKPPSVDAYKKKLEDAIKTSTKSIIDAKTKLTPKKTERKQFADQLKELEGDREKYRTAKVGAIAAVGLSIIGGPFAILAVAGACAIGLGIAHHYEKKLIAEIDALKKKIGDLDTEIGELEEEIQEFKAEKADATRELKAEDQQDRRDERAKQSGAAATAPAPVAVAGAAATPPASTPIPAGAAVSTSSVGTLMPLTTGSPGPSSTSELDRSKDERYELQSLLLMEGLLDDSDRQLAKKRLTELEERIRALKAQSGSAEHLQQRRQFP